MNELRALDRILDDDRRDELNELSKVLKRNAIVSGRDRRGFMTSSSGGQTSRAVLERQWSEMASHIKSDGLSLLRCGCRFCKGKGKARLIEEMRNLNGGWKSG